MHILFALQVHEEVQEMCEEILLVLDSSQQGFAGSLNLKSLQKRVRRVSISVGFVKCFLFRRLTRE